MSTNRPTTPTPEHPRAALMRVREALDAMVADVQDEHEAHEAEDEGFIVACHVPYGDVLRARSAIAKLDALLALALDEEHYGEPVLVLRAPRPDAEERLDAYIADHERKEAPNDDA